jgi:hypothetical protein
MAQVTFDGKNAEAFLAALGAVRGGVKGADHDEPGSPPSITAELPDGTLVAVEVDQIVEVPDGQLDR